MKFTDEDVKRFRNEYDQFPVEKIDALLARLEAAEELRKHGENLFIELRLRLQREIENKSFPRDSRPDTYLKQWERYYEAWRRAKGETGE